MRVYQINEGYLLTEDKPENDKNIFGLEVREIDKNDPLGIEGGNRNIDDFKAMSTSVISVLFNKQATPETIRDALERWGFEIEEGTGKYQNFIRAKLPSPVRCTMFFGEGSDSEPVRAISADIKKAIGHIIKNGDIEPTVSGDIATFEEIDKHISGHTEEQTNPRNEAYKEPNQQTIDYLSYFKEHVASSRSSPPWDKMDDDEIEKVDIDYFYNHLTEEEAEEFREKTQNDLGFTIAQFNDLVKNLDSRWWPEIIVYQTGYNYDNGETINLNPYEEDPEEITYDKKIKQKDFDDIDNILSAFATQDMKRGFAHKIDLPSLNDELTKRLIEICQKHQLSFEDDFNFELDFYEVDSKKFKQMVIEAVSSKKPLDLRNKDVSGFSMFGALAELSGAGVDVGSLNLDQAFLGYSRMRSGDFEFLNKALRTIDQLAMMSDDVDIIRPKSKEKGAIVSLEEKTAELLSLFEKAHRSKT